MKVLHIKNMVCYRCILVVEQALSFCDLSESIVEMGKVTLQRMPTRKDLNRLKVELEKVGFELLTGKEDQIIEKTKLHLIRKVNDLGSSNPISLSEFLEQKTSMNYSKLSRLFSAQEGITIERYYIRLKVEKVKELIKYDKLTISEISYELDYSSPQHLAKQFKQITGMTTSQFREEGTRSKLDNIKTK